MLMPSYVIPGMGLSYVIPGGSAFAAAAAANVARPAKTRAIAIRANFILPPIYLLTVTCEVAARVASPYTREGDRDRRYSECPKYWLKKGSHTRSNRHITEC